MSNLGAYQWMTSAAKMVGGPINLLILTGATGAVAYKTGELIVKWCIKKHKTTCFIIEDKKEFYNVTSTGRSNEGVKFDVGDRIFVLEEDGDSVLIEKIGDTNSPYFVSTKFLRQISEYK